jgi:hypothetical protein
MLLRGPYRDPQDVTETYPERGNGDIGMTRYIKVKVKDKNDIFYDRDENLHVNILTSYALIRCSVCDKEAFRIHGFIGDMKEDIEGSIGNVVICKECVPKHMLIPKAKLP